MLTWHGDEDEMSEEWEAREPSVRPTKRETALLWLAVALSMAAAAGAGIFAR